MARRKLRGIGILALAVLAYNNLMALAPGEARDLYYVPANLAFLGLLFAVAVPVARLERQDLGLAAPHLGRAALAGVGIGMAVPAPLFLLVAFPGLVDEGATDPRAADSLAQLLYQALFRIPLGTALFEEMLFRGLLYGVTVKFYGARAAIVWSSALFGLWHIAPTYKLLRGAAGIEAEALLAVAVAGGVLATFLGGLFFAVLRHRTRHVAGCVLAHGLINSLSAVAVYVRA